MGKPKSEAGERVIPLWPLVANTLKEWKLICPRASLDLVFPNTLGKIWDHADIVSRYLWPVLIAAGVVKTEGKRRGQIHRPSLAPALLCLMAYQPEERRRARTAAEVGAGPAWGTHRLS